MISVMDVSKGPKNHKCPRSQLIVKNIVIQNDSKKRKSAKVVKDVISASKKLKQ